MELITTPCPTCNQIGKDQKHQWPDGTPATCPECNGYGNIDFHTYQSAWVQVPYDLDPLEPWAEAQAPGDRSDPYTYIDVGELLEIRDFYERDGTDPEDMIPAWLIRLCKAAQDNKIMELKLLG